MSLDETGSLYRVRTTKPMRVSEGGNRHELFQLVTIGAESEDLQLIWLKGRSVPELTILKDAIVKMTTTHEAWNRLRDSFALQETARPIRLIMQKENSDARMLLSEHGIHLRKFSLPEPAIEHEK